MGTPVATTPGNCLTNLQLCSLCHTPEQTPKSELGSVSPCKSVLLSVASSSSWPWISIYLYSGGFVIFSRSPHWKVVLRRSRTSCWSISKGPPRRQRPIPSSLTCMLITSVVGETGSHGSLPEKFVCLEWLLVFQCFLNILHWLKG